MTFLVYLIGHMAHGIHDVQPLSAHDADHCSRDGLSIFDMLQLDSSSGTLGVKSSPEYFTLSDSEVSHRTSGAIKVQYLVMRKRTKLRQSKPSAFYPAIVPDGSSTALLR